MPVREHRAKPGGQEDSAWARGLLAVAVVVCAAVYLQPFVGRGWIPHDEGTLAGDAVRLMQGELPHVDFQDPYSGAMTWMYAWLFTAFGTDLVTIRWALFVAALATVLFWYWIGLQFVSAPAAMGVALVALTWAFPNYFAGLPSWWVLVLASTSIVLLMRFFRTRAEKWVFLAGLTLGVGCAFKQNGVYLLAAATLALAYDERVERSAECTDRRRSWSGLLLRIAIVLTIMIGLSVLVGLHATPNMAVLVVTPIAAVTLFVLFDEYRFGGFAASRAPGSWGLVRRVALLGAGCTVPLCLLMSPYVLTDRLSAFVHGTLILPQARSNHAAYEVLPPIVAIGLLPYVVLLYRFMRRAKSSLLPLAIALMWYPLVAVAIGYRHLLGYRLIWNGVRFSLLVILPLVFIGLLRPINADDANDRMRRVTALLLAAMASYLSLFQFPFAAPVYFCYVAPLVILSLLAAVSVQSVFPSEFSIPLFVSLALFAVASVNRGYVETIGMKHEVVHFNQPLNIARASLLVRPADADTYRRVVSLLASHARGRFIYAFPDCPEVYFLSNRSNPTPVNFDFFLPLSNEVLARMWDDRGITAIVVNHGPAFSPPPSRAQLTAVRQMFPDGERVARFEVRWRQGAATGPGPFPRAGIGRPELTPLTSAESSIP